MKVKLVAMVALTVALASGAGVAVAQAQPSACARRVPTCI
jgi:hypothetical protein